MKKMKDLLFAIALAAIAGGCTDLNKMEHPKDGAMEINISGGIQQKATRATAEGFVNGDAVGIYVVNYENSQPGTLLDKGNQADHVQYTFNEGENRWISMGKVYYKDDVTPVDIYGYYPYAKPANVSTYEFELQRDQSTPTQSDKMGGYEASDFLWGKTGNIIPSVNPVRIAYEHKMSCAIVILSKGTGFAEGEFERVESSVMATGVTRKSTINLSTGVVTPQGNAEITGTVMNPTTEGFRGIVVPQSIAAQTALFAITLDGIVYNFKKDEEFTYQAGGMSRFTITINKKEITGTYELVLSDLSILPWEEDTESHAGEARQYYVVNVEEPGKLGETLKKLNKNGAKIKNLKVTGTINARDFFYMRDNMAVLQGLNLKEVKIDYVEILRSEDKDNQGTYLANEIPQNAYKNNKSIYYFTLPDGITKINSFPENIAGSIVIPDGVIEIAASMVCPNVVGLILPPSLKKINGLVSLLSMSSELSLPYGIESINSIHGAFSGNLDLPNSLTHIGSISGNFTGNLVIPEKVTSVNRISGKFRGQLILHDNFILKEGCFDRNTFTGELVLPKNITTIPKDAFAGCLFSSIAGFPETLTEIGDNAFASCSRLSGVLVFPKDLVSIGASAFLNCGNLEGVVFPERLSIIKGYAFNGCNYINSIVSKSLIPPVLSGNVFDGVNTNNFTVEVPEMSINKYQTTSGWSLFKRISAYRDFSINRRFTRWLNAGGSAKLYLKALEGAEWSLDSKPDWITVTPSSGKGKTEVSISTGTLATGSPTRTGEIIFKLNGTDYTQKTTVEQYNYQYGDGDVVTLKRATKGKGINIVVMGDCYDAKDISEGNYLKNITEAYQHIFTVEPYKTYADYFNVYGVFGLSEDSGMGTINLEKNARFGSQYFIHEGVSPDMNTCFEYAKKAPINDNLAEAVVILIPNTTIYAGITYMYGDGTSLAVCPMSEDAYPYDFRGIIQHEVGGHAFGKLADEYIYVHNWIDKCACNNPHSGTLNEGKSRGWFRNLSLTSDLHSVDWSHLIFHPSYSNIVDVFEGGYFHTKNVWRSEPNSCMNNNIPYFNAISRQDIVERIMKIAGEPFKMDDFFAKDVKFVNPATKTTSQHKTEVPYSNGQQYPPKYMGEKPEFKSTKK